MQRPRRNERVLPLAIVGRQNAMRQALDDELMARMSGSRDSHSAGGEAKADPKAAVQPAAAFRNPPTEREGASAPSAGHAQETGGTQVASGKQVRSSSSPAPARPGSIRSTTTPVGMHRAHRGVAAEAAGTETACSDVVAVQSVPAREGRATVTAST